MKPILQLLLLMLFSQNLSAQKSPQVSVGFINTGTAYPFTQFGKLFSQVQQPGIELVYFFNWRTKDKHDWYQEFKLAYFNHRFVQHAFPLYTDIGYRYKFPANLTLQAAIGAGYMHSIPATAKLKLDANGDYKNDKGIGRAQAVATANLGVGYVIKSRGKMPSGIRITYQQLLQTPFVKSYVPVLPYNSLIVAFSISL